MFNSNLLTLILSFFLLSLNMIACSNSNSNSSTDPPAKILVYNDGTVVVNGDVVEDNDFKGSIEKAIQPNSEIWYWLENPYGIPEGNAYEISEIVTKLAPFHVIKLFHSEDLSEKYTLISDPAEGI